MHTKLSKKDLELVKKAAHVLTLEQTNLDPSDWNDLDREVVNTAYGLWKIVRMIEKGLEK